MNWRVRSSRKTQSEDFKQDVWDFTSLLDKFLGEEGYDSSKHSVPAALRNADLTDWILNLQDESEGAWSHAMQQWEKTHSLPWLVAAMTNSAGNTPGVDRLLDAAARLDHSSPAFASVAFHRLRLLIESAAWRSAANSRWHPCQTTVKVTAFRDYLFLSQRQLWPEYRRVSAKRSTRPAASSATVTAGNPRRRICARKGLKFFFDVDSTNFLNRAMPLDILADAAVSKTLPVNLRRDVAQAAFMRASLLDDRENAPRLAGLLGDLHPAAKSLVSAYQRAATPDARRFAGAYLALKFPGLRPHVTAGIGRGSTLEELDSYRDNWWCSAAPDSISEPLSDGERATQAKAKPIKPPEFLAALNLSPPGN